MRSHSNVAEGESLAGANQFYHPSEKQLEEKVIMVMKTGAFYFLFPFIHLVYPLYNVFCVYIPVSVGLEQWKKGCSSFDHV